MKQTLNYIYCNQYANNKSSWPIIYLLAINKTEQINIISYQIIRDTIEDKISM